MDKIKYAVSMGTLLAAFALLVTCIIWLIYPYKTITFANIPFPVDQIVYRADDCLRVHMEYERFTDVQSTAIIRFTDGITYTMLPVVFQKAPGKFKGVSMSVRIPQTLPPGRYYLDICFTYEVNPIRNTVVNARTTEFDVQ